METGVPGQYGVSETPPVALEEQSLEQENATAQLLYMVADLVTEILWNMLKWNFHLVVSCRLLIN